MALALLPAHPTLAADHASLPALGSPRAAEAR
jgi:hypothetical protein